MDARRLAPRRAGGPHDAADGRQGVQVVPRGPPEDAAPARQSVLAGHLGRHCPHIFQKKDLSGRLPKGEKPATAAMVVHMKSPRGFVAVALNTRQAAHQLGKRLGKTYVVVRCDDADCGDAPLL